MKIDHETMKQMQRSATLVFCEKVNSSGRESERRTAAIQHGIQTQFGSYGGGLFDDSEQVKTRGVITEAEILEYVNSVKGKQFIEATRVEADKRLADFESGTDEE